MQCVRCLTLMYNAGAARSLPKFERGNARAVAVNDSGLVVGFDMFNGIVWRNGQATKLPSNGVSLSEANCVNARGGIAGTAEFPKDGPGFRMCLWQAGKPRDIGTLTGFSYCSALAINDSCVVVGTAERNKAEPYAVLYRGSKMVDLNDLVPLPHGAILEEAIGIDNHGRIIGNGRLGGKSVGFVLTPVKHRR